MIKNGNILETLVTDKNGEAISSDYSIKDYDKLYLQEIETAQGYILDDEIKEVKLQESKEENCYTVEYIYKNVKEKTKTETMRKLPRTGF